MIKRKKVDITVTHLSYAILFPACVGCGVEYTRLLLPRGLELDPDMCGTRDTWQRTCQHFLVGAGSSQQHPCNTHTHNSSARRRPSYPCIDPIPTTSPITAAPQALRSQEQQYHEANDKEEKKPGEDGEGGRWRSLATASRDGSPTHKMADRHYCCWRCPLPPSHHYSLHTHTISNSNITNN